MNPQPENNLLISQFSMEPTPLSEKQQKPLDLSQYGHVTLLSPPGGLKKALEQKSPTTPEDIQGLRALRRLAGRI